jgi:hypothetical protein
MEMKKILIGCGCRAERRALTRIWVGAARCDRTRCLITFERAVAMGEGICGLKFGWRCYDEL